MVCPLPCLHANPQTHSPVPQALGTCISLPRILLHTFPPTPSSYLSWLTPILQFSAQLSPPPGHSVTSQSRQIPFVVHRSHPFIRPVILNSGHTLRSPKEDVKSTDAQTPAQVLTRDGRGSTYLKNSQAQPQWRTGALSHTHTFASSTRL